MRRDSAWLSTVRVVRVRQCRPRQCASVAIGLGVVWGLIGCTTSQQAATPASSNSTPSEQPAQSTPEPDPESAAESTVCSDDTATSIQRAITAQSLALSQGDFDTAYAFASPAFREAVDLSMFERVITRQYDMLLYFESARFGRCEVTSENVATLPVEVRSEFYRPVVMTYEMVHVDGTWFVSAVDNPVSGIPNA